MNPIYGFHILLKSVIGIMTIEYKDENKGDGGDFDELSLQSEQERQTPTERVVELNPSTLSPIDAAEAFGDSTLPSIATRSESIEVGPEQDPRRPEILSKSERYLSQLTLRGYRHAPHIKEGMAALEDAIDKAQHSDFEASAESLSRSFLELNRARKISDTQSLMLDLEARPWESQEPIKILEQTMGHLEYGARSCMEYLAFRQDSQLEASKINLVDAAVTIVAPNTRKD